MHTGPQKRRRRQQSVCASCLSFRACPALILSTPFRAILIFNHPSYVDAAAIAVMFTPSSVSKAGVAELPFIGLFGLALQLFFIERRGSNDAANPYVLRGDVVAAIAQRAADRLCGLGEALGAKHDERDDRDEDGFRRADAEERRGDRLFLEGFFGGVV